MVRIIGEDYRKLSRNITMDGLAPGCLSPLLKTKLRENWGGRGKNPLFIPNANHSICMPRANRNNPGGDRWLTAVGKLDLPHHIQIPARSFRDTERGALHSAAGRGCKESTKGPYNHGH